MKVWHGEDVRGRKDRKMKKDGRESAKPACREEDDVDPAGWRNSRKGCQLG